MKAADEDLMMLLTHFIKYEPDQETYYIALALHLIDVK